VTVLFVFREAPLEFAAILPLISHRVICVPRRRKIVPLPAIDPRGLADRRNTDIDKIDLGAAEWRPSLQFAPNDAVIRQVDSNTGFVLLLKLYKAGLIEPYVLFSLGDLGIGCYPMRLRDWPIPIVALLMILCLSPMLRTQTTPDVSYRTERQKAAELFNQGKRLEALPLL
jgi:hypothetical protein